MAKSGLSLRVPSNLEDAVQEYQDQEGLDSSSEAAKQLLRAGVDAQAGHGPGERLVETATGVSAVGGLVAALAAVTGSTVGLSLVIPFLGAAFTFSVLWAAIRTLAGGPFR